MSGAVDLEAVRRRAEQTRQLLNRLRGPDTAERRAMRIVLNDVRAVAAELEETRTALIAALEKMQH